MTHSVEYTYDAYDRRIAKVVDNDGAGTTPATTEHPVYEGAHVSLVFDESGNLTQRYLYGPQIDQVLAQEDAQTGDVLWALTDHQGTVRDVVNSDGDVVNHITYDSFGQVTSETNPDVDFRFGFTGRDVDEETDLYYYRARYYDPAVGQFISEDPIGFSAGDANLYRYTSNNPLIFTDPLGLAQEFIGRVYVINDTANNQVYVGSSAQELRRRFSRHRWRSLIQSVDTEITFQEVQADLDISSSRRGTVRSARNEALRSAEQRVINRERSSGRNLLNDRPAASGDNMQTWRQRHDVTLRRRVQVYKNPGTILNSVGGALAVVDAFRLARDMQLSQYDFTPYILSDERGEFTLEWSRDGFFDLSNDFYKNYISEDEEENEDGNRVQISASEFYELRDEARALFGYIDWRGEFVPGLILRELPVEGQVEM